MIRESARFAQIARALAALYLALLVFVLLRPFNFASYPAKSENSVEWLSNGEGVRFGPSGMLVSAAPPTGLHRQLVSGQGLAIELWLRSASSDQERPARIISYSANFWESNFTLGQEGEELIMRLRTTNKGANGTPSVDVHDAFVLGKMQHIVATFDFVEERVYVDGKIRAAATTHPGSFETWDPSFFLVFGNEFNGGRAWNGDIAYAAIYDRPLPAQVVAARYEAGYRPIESPAPPGRVAAFNFTHGLNGLESGAAGAEMPAPLPPLTKPARVGELRPFLSFLNGRLVVAESSRLDLVLNLVLFIPFGVFVFAALEKRAYPAARTILLSVIGAGFISAMFEVLQLFLSQRTSSIFDLGSNTAGALVGALGCWCWCWLQRRALRGSIRRPAS
jgi:hypothetical protein